MLKWAVIILVVALIAASLGYGGFAATASGFAVALFWIFLAITVVLFVVGLLGGRRASP